MEHWQTSSNFRRISYRYASKDGILVAVNSLPAFREGELATASEGLREPLKRPRREQPQNGQRPKTTTGMVDFGHPSQSHSPYLSINYGELNWHINCVNGPLVDPPQKGGRRVGGRRLI